MLIISGDKCVLLSSSTGKSPFTREIYFLLSGRQRGGSGVLPVVK